MMRSVRKGAATAGLAALCLFLNTPAARALQQTLTVFTASGSIVSQEFCSPTEVCQVALISGRATQFGAFAGVLSERVDLQTGTCTGTGKFHVQRREHDQHRVPGPGGLDAVRGGSLFRTAPDRRRDRPVWEATGQLAVAGLADATGKVSVIGVGRLSW